MPIYEYYCPKCKQKFEKMRPVSQATEGAPCPSCHEMAERKLSTFCALSGYGDGLTRPIGSNSCSSCSLPGCDSCGI